MKLWKEVLARKTAVDAARGMTLLEIMVVIAIIGIVATAITVGVVGYLNKAKVKACTALIQNISQQLDLHYATESEYPSSLSVLAEGKGAPLKEKQLKDQWGQDFIYNYPSQENDLVYDLCSSGPDKSQGTEDDICND